MTIQEGEDSVSGGRSMPASGEEVATGAPDNVDRVLIAGAVAAGRRNVPIDTNPAFLALSTRLIESGQGELTVSFVAGPETSQGNGVVSGGTLAAMLDNAIALAVLSQLRPGQTCATISLTINMMKPAFVGTLGARSRVDRLGGRVAFASAELFDDREQLVAKAVSSLAIFRAV
ncbi:MAG TPA: PaaI family thioesterase [Sphingomonas sp.]|nr:PaaI family thioesterase [Sphingomonas sp.]